MCQRAPQDQGTYPGNACPMAREKGAGTRPSPFFKTLVGRNGGNVKGRWHCGFILGMHFSTSGSQPSFKQINVSLHMMDLDSSITNK